MSEEANDVGWYERLGVRRAPQRLSSTAKTKKVVVSNVKRTGQALRQERIYIYIYITDLP